MATLLECGTMEVVLKYRGRAITIGNRAYVRLIAVPPELTTA